jgi:protein-tyrosine-phosphatase
VSEGTNTTRILLVCTGNICRSPLAAALLERALAERGTTGLDVSSAGTGAWDGAPVSEGAYLVGLERGLDLSGHRARLLTRELVEQADLVLTMARHHRARVDELGGEGHVFVLGEYAGRDGDEAEVSDPFGGDLEVYRDTCAELEALLQAAVDRIVKEFASGSQR